MLVARRGAGIASGVRAFSASAPVIPAQKETSVNASIRKGTGGRASFSGNVVTVFGATGRLGLPIVNRLARQGNQIIIPYRQDPYYVRELKVVGELGQILFFPFELKDEATIRKVLRYSNIVINLIGTTTSPATKNYSHDETHVSGARRLAKIAREMGVDRFIHMSALGATPTPERGFYVGENQWLKTKGLGEIAVREEFPDATIVRPSVIYGEQDAFINDYVSRWRKMPYDKVFLYKAGEKTIKMPVYVCTYN